MGPNLSRKFNWMGKKGKRPFKDLELSKVVFGKFSIYSHSIIIMLAYKCSSLRFELDCSNVK
jgi:hypothetical protein